VAASYSEELFDLAMAMSGSRALAEDISRIHTAAMFWLISSQKRVRARLIDTLSPAEEMICVGNALEASIITCLAVWLFTATPAVSSFRMRRASSIAFFGTPQDAAIGGHVAISRTYETVLLAMDVSGSQMLCTGLFAYQIIKSEALWTLTTFGHPGRAMEANKYRLLTKLPTTEQGNDIITINVLEGPPERIQH
jgi:hypothetical protein